MKSSTRRAIVLVFTLAGALAPWIKALSFESRHGHRGHEFSTEGLAFVVAAVATIPAALVGLIIGVIVAAIISEYMPGAVRATTPPPKSPPEADPTQDNENA